MLNLNEKKQIVAELNEQAKNASSMIVAHYRGMSVGQITDLRQKAEENQVKIKVTKNTLAKRALEKTSHACLIETLTGPVLLAFSADDPGSAARVFKDFTKTNKLLEVKALSLGSTLINSSELARVASLPTYDQAIAQLMGTMNAPIAKLVSTFNEIPSKVTRVVAAVKDKKV